MSVASGQRPLPGPDVLAAQLFAGGRGYVRTTDALLWTDDFGASWRTITPPGRARYALAATPDGSAYLLLHARSGPGSHPVTWVSARGTRTTG